MRLYIANCTRQNQTIYYRLDYDNNGNPKEAERTRFQPALQQTIPAGRQAQLGTDFHKVQVTEIVDQLARYGLIGVVDVPRQKQMAPYVFNIDKPVPADIMRKVSDCNSSVLIEQGQLRRRRAAIEANGAVMAAVESQIAANGTNPDEEPSPAVKVGFEQLEQSEAGERRIEEGYTVDPNAPSASGRTRFGQKRGKRGR